MTIQLPPTISIERLLKYAKEKKEFGADHPGYKKVLKKIRRSESFAATYLWLCEAVRTSKNETAVIRATTPMKALNLTNESQTYRNFSYMLGFGLLAKESATDFHSCFKTAINLANEALIFEAQKRLICP